ncbi:MAG TPA: ABC transporter ATP-binding protein [Acidimicrobiales bacterium]|jgi:branched-chain amino acid transport system ATP-binding protein
MTSTTSTAIADGHGDTLPAAVELSHVDAGYGPYRALFDVSFQVHQGSIKALLGSNGAGKSTVARVITGLLRATNGVVRVGSLDVVGTSTHNIARLGVAHVPEGRGIFASLSVEENLTLVFRQRAGRRQVSDSLTRAYDAFPILKENRHKRGVNLSGGQQRLLSLASFLVVPPKLLIADELSLGLAPVAVDTVYEGLREIHRAGTALLIVEQQVDRILELADEAVILQCGAVAFDGPASEASGAIDRILATGAERAPSIPSAGAPKLHAIDFEGQPLVPITRNGHSRG